MKFVKNVLFLSTLIIIGETLESIPTIYEKKLFDKFEDSKDLYNAFNNLNTLDNKIIEVLCDRNFAQRQEIANEYLAQYNETLEETILLKTEGDFQTLLLDLIEDQYLRDVKVLKNEMPYEPVFEILATRRPEELEYISKLFKEQYNGYSIDDLIGEKVSARSRRVLRKFLHRNGEEKVLNEKNIEKYAKILHDLTKTKMKSFDFKEEMNRIDLYTEVFTTLSWQQLRKVSKKYEEKYRHTLDEAIGQLMSGLEKYGFQLMNGLAKNKNVQYAKMLKETMRGFGTRGKQLIRLIVSRSEIDLESIKLEYAKMFGVTLIESIIDETSSSFRDGLIAIVNGNISQ